MTTTKARALFQEPYSFHDRWAHKRCALDALVVFGPGRGVAENRRANKLGESTGRRAGKVRGYGCLLRQHR